MWHRFSALLDFELRQLDRFTGSAYRAIDFRVPPALYREWSVVTWNQPSSASVDPRVARRFLWGQVSGSPVGTLFIIEAETACDVAPYSVYPDEKEVLFRAGSQFQVLHRARPGLKSLLQAVMRCDLSTVDVCEMRELTLGCWRDLRRFLPPADLEGNTELLEFIDTLPTRRMVVRNVMTDVCQPMTSLAIRPGDGTSVLHMAVRVPNNLPCVQLVSARLAGHSFRHRDSEGFTALEVAIACGHADAAVYLMHRSSAWHYLLPSQLNSAASWVCC